MKKVSGIVTAILFIALAFFSCTKEEVRCHNNVKPLPPGSAEVNACLLNGKNPAGRWTVGYVQTLHYKNDTLISTDTASVMPGMEVVNILLDGSIELWEQNNLVDTGFYQVNTGSLDFSVASGTGKYKFGVSNCSGKMRWNTTESYTMGQDVYSTETNIILQRY